MQQQYQQHTFVSHVLYVAEKPAVLGIKPIIPCDVRPRTCMNLIVHAARRGGHSLTGTASRNPLMQELLQLGVGSSSSGDNQKLLPNHW